jgi:hypothetical protein
MGALNFLLALVANTAVAARTSPAAVIKILDFFIKNVLRMKIMPTLLKGFRLLLVRAN